MSDSIIPKITMIRASLLRHRAAYTLAASRGSRAVCARARNVPVASILRPTGAVPSSIVPTIAGHHRADPTGGPDGYRAFHAGRAAYSVKDGSFADTDGDGKVSKAEYKAYKATHDERAAADLHVWETHRDGNGGLPDWVEDWSPEVFRRVGLFLAGGWGAFALYGLQQPWIHNITIAALFVPVAGYWMVGNRDLAQKRHAVRRNFPVLGNVRYLFEMIRPEIRQYFIEGEHDEHPFGRANRSIVYQRAKSMTDTLPLGTRKDYYATGREWANHSPVVILQRTFVD